MNIFDLFILLLTGTRVCTHIRLHFPRMNCSAWIVSEQGGCMFNSPRTFAKVPEWPDMKSFSYCQCVESLPFAGVKWRLIVSTI